VDLFNARSTLVQARYDYQIQIANVQNLLGIGVDEDAVDEVLEGQDD
jgi:outer membrane protein TolC